MKTLYYILIFILATIGCFSENNSSNDHLSFCSDEYYQALANQAPNKNFLVAVNGRKLNGDSGSFYMSTYWLAKFLLRADTLDLQSAFAKALNQEIVVEFDSEISGDIRPYGNCEGFNQIFEQGKEASMKNLFNVRQQKREVVLTQAEQGCLIEQLNKWCYLVAVDDETGLLYVTELADYLYWLENRIPE